MKSRSTKFSGIDRRQFFPSLLNPSVAVALAVATLSAPDLANAAGSQTFATPEAAVAALIAAASADDTNALRLLFGPAGVEIENPDRVQAANEHREFNAAVNQLQRLVRESDAKYVLEIGTNAWPFPIPIVLRAGQWSFDTEAGRDEILNRHIGKNELATLQSVRAFVEAQREYAAHDHDGDEVLEYAQKFLSSPGTKDGLYWPADLDGEISPLGPLVAQAQDLGYGKTPRKAGAAPQPFQGYLFKILTRQTKAAPGGKYDYLINGNMIGGFALVAWPAEYGESGIMTFIVNQQGRVYQKDLGAKTTKIAAALKEYNPDKTWTISRE